MQIGIKVSLKAEEGCRSKDKFLQGNFLSFTDLFKDSLSYFLAFNIIKSLEGIDRWIFINPFTVVRTQVLDKGVRIAHHFGDGNPRKKNLFEFLIEVKNNIVDNIAKDQEII